ncbi:hypothetical protein [Streptomyces sp. MAR4 CNX-425]
MSADGTPARPATDIPAADIPTTDAPTTDTPPEQAAERLREVASA